MKKLAFAAVLAMLPAMAMAQTRGSSTTTDSGASSNAPGQQMQDKGSRPGQPGASGYAPGQRMQAKGSVKGKPGASDYAPGQKAKQR
jgi:hypothetical protein